MQIECFMSIGCGSEDALRKNVAEALTLGSIDAQVIFRRITDEEANALGLKGSPTIFIDGVDIEPQEMPGFS